MRLPRTAGFFVTVAALVVVGAGCSGFLAPETPSASCRGRRCSNAVERGARDFGCAESDVLVRERSEGRLVATGCGKQADYVCSRSKCGRRGAVRSIATDAETRYRASLELYCQADEVELASRSDGFDASCRGASLHFACGPTGCHSTGSTDEMMVYLRQQEPAVLDCLDRSPATIDVKFDAEGRIVRVTGAGFQPAFLRGTNAHRVQDTSPRGCILRAFANAPRDPSRAGRTFVVTYGARGEAPAEAGDSEEPAEDEDVP